MAEGVPFFFGSRSLEGDRRAARQRSDDAVPRRRARHAGPDHGARAGDQLLDRVGQARADPQPVGPGARCRRLQRRRRRPRRGRRGADRARQRRSRLDPHPRRLLRARRAQAEPRPHPVRAGRRRAAVRRRRRLRAHPHRARRRPPPRRDPRARRRRQVLRAAAARALRRRAAASSPGTLRVGGDDAGVVGRGGRSRGRRRGRARPAACSRTSGTSSPTRARPSTGRPSCAAASARWPPSPRRSSRRRGRPTRAGSKPSPGRSSRRRRSSRALDLLAAFDAQNRVTRSVGAFFTEHDLLVTPTLGQLPAPHGTLRYDDPDHTTRTWLESLFDYGPFTAVFNISGQPAISLPLAAERERPADRRAARRPATAARICCSGSPPSSKRPCPGVSARGEPRARESWRVRRRRR